MNTHDWIASHASAMEHLLIDWCSINSGSSHRAGLDRMRAALHHAFTALPCTTEDVPLGPDCAPGFRALCRPEAPLQILLNGHMDTVYGADHPFQHCDRPQPGLLRGPGTADMKGGLVVLLHSVLALERHPQAGQLGWEVYIGPDEETGSRASAPVFAELARRHRLGLVFEPASGGDLVRGRMGIGVLTATCHGRAAHAGRARGAGRNAVVALAGFLVACDALNESLPGILLNVGNCTGGGPVNIVPHFARAEINLRVTRPEQQQPLLDALQRLADDVSSREGYRLELSGGFTRPPKVVGPEEERLFGVLREEAAGLGLNLGWRDVGGGSDGNLLSAGGLTNLDGLGVRGDHLHSDQEFIELASLVERTRLATRLLERIATGEVPLPPRRL